MISYSSRLLFRVKVSIFSICFCFPPLGVKSFALLCDIYVKIVLKIWVYDLIALLHGDWMEKIYRLLPKTVSSVFHRHNFMQLFYHSEYFFFYCTPLELSVTSHDSSVNDGFIYIDLKQGVDFKDIVKLFSCRTACTFIS